MFRHPSGKPKGIGVQGRSVVLCEFNEMERDEGAK